MARSYLALTAPLSNTLTEGLTMSGTTRTIDSTDIATALGQTITLGGSLATSGGAIAFTATAATSVTLPTSGALLAGTASQYGVLIGGASGAVASLSPGSSGMVLVSGGESANPAFATLTSGSISGFSAAASEAAPVQSVVGRTGAVTLASGDISGLSALATATNGAGLILTNGTLSAAVQSVAGRTGAVTLAYADISGLGTLATVGSVSSALAINSGTLGLSTMPAGTVIGNGGTGSAAPTNLVLNPSNFLISNGTISTSGTVATINVTSATGFEINGTACINIDSLSNTCVGFGAGTLTTNGLNAFFGYLAGQNNTTGGENTFIGYLSGQMNTTGGFLTGVGEHTIGRETTANYTTAVGNDSQRNLVSYSNLGGNTSVGKSSMYAGGGYQNTSVGFNSLHGNGSAVIIGGTPTTGDVISLTFTGSFTGSPQTVNYTVPGGATLGSIATGILAAISANSTLNGVDLSTTTSSVVDTSNIQLSFWGTATSGTSIVITSSVSGAATETVAITGGNVGWGNVAIGYQAMVGYYMSSATWNVGVGYNTLYALSTGTSNVGVGDNAGYAITTGVGNICIGHNAAAASTTPGVSGGTPIVAIGSNALATNVTGGANVAIGASAMQFYNGVYGASTQASVAIGPSALKGTASSSYFNNVAVGGNAGAAVSTGSRNTLIGSLAGQVLTTGSSNTIIGENVGAGTLTTGSGNIYIGAGGPSVTIDAATASESNTFRIGNNATNLMRATGINTATPAFFLDWIPASTTYANDSAAATGGVSIGQIYRNGSVLQCRVA